MSNLKKEDRCMICEIVIYNGDTCNQCCEHEFDADEGYMCLNCGEQGEPDLWNEDGDQER